MNTVIDETSLVFRLLKRDEIRRQIPSRKSVQQGLPDRIADLLEEAAIALQQKDTEISCLKKQLQDSKV